MKMKYLALLGTKQAQFSLLIQRNRYKFFLHLIYMYYPKAKTILNQNTCCTALASSSAMPFIVLYIIS